MCGLILEFQKICVFWAKIWHWHKTRRSFGKVCPLGCSEKVSCVPKSRGVNDSISTSITLCWYFLFFSFSCSTKINSVDLLNSHAWHVHRRMLFLLVTRKDVRKVTAEFLYWWRVTRLDLGSASDWLCRERRLLQPIGSTIQIWEVTCN